MAKTVTIRGSEVTHLLVSDEHKSPLCGATHEGMSYEGRRTGIGDVTCTRCKQVLKTAVVNALASE